MSKKSAVLLLGFGGPEEMAEVRPFLDLVLQGIRIPKERYEEVARHYEMFGGKSPYNEITFKQRASLEKWLADQKKEACVAVGFRNARPFFKDAIKTLKRHGTERVVGFVLSNFRSFSSFEKYTEKVAEAMESEGGAMQIVYTPNFHDEPLFIRAQADRIQSVIQGLNHEELSKTFFLFTAHSIPLEMSKKSFYDKQFEKTSERIAESLKLESWGMGYQSRSGNPRDPWLQPDATAILRGLDKSRYQSVVLVPVGFLCDNVEVLYDLDIEARKEAESLGFKYLRAKTVMDHPLFIEMMGQSVCALL